MLVRPLAVLRRSLMSRNGIARVVASWAADAGGLGRPRARVGLESQDVLVSALDEEPLRGSSTTFSSSELPPPHPASTTTATRTPTPGRTMAGLYPRRVAPTLRQAAAASAPTTAMADRTTQPA
jgi:hypothetical protein